MRLLRGRHRRRLAGQMVRNEFLIFILQVFAELSYLFVRKIAARSTSTEGSSFLFVNHSSLDAMLVNQPTHAVSADKGKRHKQHTEPFYRRFSDEVPSTEGGGGVASGFRLPSNVRQRLCSMLDSPSSTGKVNIVQYKVTQYRRACAIRPKK